jgi:nitrogen regulatory protein PII
VPDFKKRIENKHAYVRAIIRPEKTGVVMSELVAAGFPALTKMDVYGRGKQKGSPSARCIMTRSERNAHDRG